MSYDTIIIGGGILGTAIGHALTEAGQKVAILEAAGLGTGTTGHSFAWANASSKTGDRAYHRLNAAGVAGWHQLLADHGPDAVPVRPGGALFHVAPQDKPGLDALDEQARVLAAYGYACIRLDSDALRAQEPDICFPAGTTALHAPDDMVIDGPGTARFFAGRVRAAGGDVFENTPAHVLMADDQGRVQGIETGKGDFRAPNVVIAAGIWTPELLAELTGYGAFASRFPMRRVPGVILETPPLPGLALPRTILCSSTSDELHILPNLAGGLRMGSDDLDHFADGGPEDEKLARAGAALLERAARLVPGLNAAVAPGDCRITVGIRPYPEDGLTIAGPLPGATGLFVVTTHSGISLAPALAPLVAEMVTSHTVPETLAPFTLNRFPGFG